MFIFLICFWNFVLPLVHINLSVGFFLFFCVHDLRKYVIPVSLHLHIYIRSIIWNLVNWIAIFDLCRFIMPPTTTATPTYTTYNICPIWKWFHAISMQIKLFGCSLLLMHTYNIHCGTHSISFFYICVCMCVNLKDMPYHVFIIWMCAAHLQLNDVEIIQILMSYRMTMYGPYTSIHNTNTTTNSSKPIKQSSHIIHISQLKL